MLHLAYLLFPIFFLADRRRKLGRKKWANSSKITTFPILNFKTALLKSCLAMSNDVVTTIKCRTVFIQWMKPILLLPCLKFFNEMARSSRKNTPICVKDPSLDITLPEGLLTYSQLRSYVLHSWNTSYSFIHLSFCICWFP